jgi:hypothetical protein
LLVKLSENKGKQMKDSLVLAFGILMRSRGKFFTYLGEVDDISTCNEVNHISDRLDEIDC